MRNQIFTSLILSAALAGAGCAHQQSAMGGSAAGDIPIDSLSATRTAILRVENNFPAEVRIYSIVGGQKAYIAEAPANGVKSFVLDPNLFPATGMEFSIEPEQTQIRQRLGPYTIQKAETIDLVIPANATDSRISIRHTFR